MFITVVVLVALFAICSFAINFDFLNEFKDHFIDDGLGWIVQLNDNNNGTSIDSNSIDGIIKELIDAVPSTIISDVFNFGDNGIKAFHAKLPSLALNLLQKHPSVKMLERDQPISVSATQSSANWNLARLSKRLLPLRSEFYYNDEAGGGTRVYIVDSGIMIQHGEFEGRAIVGKSFTGDGDADGYGHGTHVAGIVGGKTYGIAKKATLVAVKVLGNNGGGTWSGVLSALNWVLQDYLSQPTKKHAIVNMSIQGPRSVAVNAAIKSLFDAGMSVVVAAGNYGDDACKYSPASSEFAIAVAATDNNDAILKQGPPSNYGQCVSILAPGFAIKSSYISSTTSAAYMSGTSMAAPHVAGILSLYTASGLASDPVSAKASLLNRASRGLVKGIDNLNTNNTLAYSLY